MLDMDYLPEPNLLTLLKLLKKKKQMGEEGGN